MVAAVEDKRGSMDELLGRLEFLDEHAADAGILESPDGTGFATARTVMIDDDRQQNPDGLTVAEVASFHEFGLGVPKRSFVRATADNETLRIEARAHDELADVVAGESASQGLTNIGRFVAREMQVTIEQSKGIRQLSATRLEQKREIGTPSTPLINWGIMIEALRHKVSRT